MLRLHSLLCAEYVNIHKLQQDHPCVLSLIKENYLMEPVLSRVPSVKRGMDPSAGQSIAVLQILRNLVTTKSRLSSPLRFWYNFINIDQRILYREWCSRWLPALQFFLFGKQYELDRFTNWTKSALLQQFSKVEAEILDSQFLPQSRKLSDESMCIPKIKQDLRKNKLKELFCAFRFHLVKLDFWAKLKVVANTKTTTLW